MVLLLHLDSCTCSLWPLCPLPALPPLLTLLGPPNAGRLAPETSWGEEGENFLSSPLFLFQNTTLVQEGQPHQEGIEATFPPAPHSLLSAL